MNAAATMTEKQACPDAERALLGALMRSAGAICEVVPVLGADDFATDAHQRVYRSIVGRWDSGKPTDLLGVADELHARGEIADIGGYGYLAELFENAGTGARAAAYAQQIRDKSLLRGLRRIGVELQRDADSPTASAFDILADASRRLDEASAASINADDSTFGLDEIVPSAIDRINARTVSGARARGVQTGFADLDSILSGLQPAELSIFAARPSVGKTSLGMSVGLHAVRSGVPTLFVSLEQSRAEIGERLLCMESRIDSHHARDGKISADDAAALCRAGDLLSDSRFVIDDRAGQSMLRIAANARRLKRQKGVGLVVVDYLQLIDPEDRRANRTEQVGSISRRLKLLAKDLDIPVLAMAQLNRDSENRSEPRLSDLRESGSIEQDADVVLLLHRMECCGPYDRILAIVGKNRNGRCGRAELTFVRHCTRFENSGIPV